MRTLACVGPLLSLCLASPAADVSLSVQNGTGSELAAYPVRGGVPLARGQWRDPQVRLVDDQDRALPCRSRPLPW